MNAPQQPGDDWMDVADAVGATRRPAKPLHPAVRHLLADDTLAAVLASWSRAAAGIETDLSVDLDAPVVLYPVADHAVCESGDCLCRLCSCPTSLCPGHHDNACSHGHWLCDGCRSWCPECRVDAIDDAQDGAR